ncbi:MAG: sortase [Actinobacteria bacterium]|nr:sortase [Actinomycetota bacterium]
MNTRETRCKQAAVVMAVVCLLLFCIPAGICDAVPEGGRSPSLLRVSPHGGGILGRDAVISLSFDSPMDLQSIGQAAYFEPSVSFAVSGESECLIVPENLLAPGAQYTFRLRSGIAEDMRGRACLEEVEISFSTRSDGVTMEIPAFSFQGEVIEGNDPQGVASVIGFGVGHFPGTGRPGRSNFVLMAHASGQVPFPFNRLFDLTEGDEIKLTYGGRDYIYRWSEGLVVRDTDVWIVDPTASPILTIFVCCAENGRPSPTFHPPYRYTVRASLSGVSPPNST